MYKTYLLTYDPLMLDPSPQRLIEFVRGHAFTYQFYTLNLGSIFIKSTAALHEMMLAYTDFLSPNMWTIVQIHSPEASAAGSAPVQFWSWINSAVPPPIPGQK